MIPLPFSPPPLPPPGAYDRVAAAVLGKSARTNFPSWVGDREEEEGQEDEEAAAEEEDEEGTRKNTKHENENGNGNASGEDDGRDQDVEVKDQGVNGHKEGKAREKGGGSAK